MNITPQNAFNAMVIIIFLVQIYWLRSLGALIHTLFKLYSGELDEECDCDDCQERAARLADSAHETGVRRLLRWRP
jgi:hypothetical protein